MTDDSAGGLAPASRTALAQAEVIIGGARHLELAKAGPRGLAWPVPFSLAPVLAARGKRTVMLTSGDPFWFGAGGQLAQELSPAEWRVHSAPSTFSMIAARLGWRLEEVTCHGLHAAPFARLRAVLAPRARMICLLRDAAAPAAFAEWLTSHGAGQAVLHICERLGGPKESVRKTTAAAFDVTEISPPVAAAVELPSGVGLSRASGLADDLFSHDGQITKRPVRALTLSALAPKPGARLWDLGAGSGSISVEWCLAGGQAISVERREDRMGHILENIDRFGLDHRMQTVLADALPFVKEDEPPDAVFVGGGAGAALFDALYARLEKGSRLVANAVTLETEALLTRLHADRGGELMRIDLSTAGPLGGMRGWQAARPVVQWAVTL